MVERLLAKEEVASSNLVFRSSEDPTPAVLAGVSVVLPGTGYHGQRQPKWRNGRRGGLKNR